MKQKRIAASVFKAVWKCAPLAVSVTLLCYFGTAAAVSLSAEILARLFGAAYEAVSGRMRGVIILAAAYMGMQILQKFLNVISDIAWNVGVEEKCRYHFRMGLQEKASALPLIDFEDAKKLDQLQRAKACVEDSVIPNGFYNIMILGECAGIVVGLMAVLCSYSLWFLPILLITIMPYPISRIRMGKEFYQLRWFQAPGIRKRDYLYSVFAGKNSQREQRIFRFGDYVKEKWEKERDQVADELNEFRVKDSRRLARCELLITLGYLLSILLSVLLVFRGNIAVGVFGAAIFAFQRVQGEVQAFFSLMATSFQEILEAGDYFAFLALEEEPKRGGQFDRLKEGIEVEGVSFAYPNTDRPAVEIERLRIHAGESTVIVGENGSGKTTLGKLLAGLYQPQKGVIRYDGQPLETISREDLAGTISAVSQSFVEYHLTVRESMGIHSPQFSGDDGKIGQALAEAGLGELAGPGEYDQQLGREFGGRELSGGQWQKLAIAGAMLKKRSILILDEPTSALDPSSEYEILSQFARMMEENTSVIISHRVGLCRLADQVIFMKEGRIAGAGSHQALMRDNEQYRSFYQEQAQWYGEKTE